MAVAEFKAGDVVRLKSGGPAMTITSIGTPIGQRGLSAWCSWFEGKKSSKGVFTLESLTKDVPSRISTGEFED